MAIVPMKKLRLMAVRSVKDELLRELLRHGCVEVSEPAELQDEGLRELLRREDSALMSLRAQRQSLQQALAILDRYVPAKSKLLSPKPQVAGERLLDEALLDEALQIAESLRQSGERIRRIGAEESRLRSTAESLQPWLGLEQPLDKLETRSSIVTLGAIPVRTPLARAEELLAEGAEEAELFPISEDKSQRYLLLLSSKEQQAAAQDALRPLGFSPISFAGMEGTAQDNFAHTEEELKTLAQERDALELAIAAQAPQRETLQLASDAADTKIGLAETEERLCGTDGVVLLQGWMPAEREAELGEIFERFGCAWETEDPAEEEYPAVPVQLKGNRVSRSMNLVTEMYSLPAYDGVDANPWMAPFFILFYGMMMADVGYGLLMVLASVLVMTRKKPEGGTAHLFTALRFCGYTTIVFGLLTGSFFGDLIPQLVRLTTGKEFAFPSLFSPLNDALAVLLGSLALGLIQIFTGMLINVIKKCKRGEKMSALCDEGAWFAVFLLLGAAALTGKWGLFLLLALALLIVTQGYGKEGVVGKLMGIGGSLYSHVTGYFSDVLSYSRLMALMLAGAVIAQVFNTLGALTGKVYLFLPIAMIGNALNFALNLLGCYVHDLRLQCLEFFGRFYEDGGKPFTPVRYITQYTKVAE